MIYLQIFLRYLEKKKIRAIINQKYTDHYNAIVINTQNNSFLIDIVKKNYYYHNNEIIEINNWREWIKNNITA